jgi:uncharacterized protein (DUF2147 family)
MRKILLAAATATAPAMAFAGGADGVWKTEADGDGAYLEVTIGACASAADKTCGIITTAFKKDGKDPAYANLGKKIVWDMTSSDGVSYFGGKIWDPEHNKTYSSKMKVKGDVLDVEGCVSIICSGQDWTRVK